MRTLLIATTNAGKLREIRPLLAGLDLQLLTLADVAPVEPPEETGQTFAENARLKARYYAEATGLPTVAEDSGLVIDELDGAPGVESARFGGVDSTYAQKFALIYERLRSKGKPGSAARFVCAIALVDPRPNLRPPISNLQPPTSNLRPPTSAPQPPPSSAILFEASGVVEGRIAPQPAGEGGFGYDPIFFFAPFGCTLAEAGDRKSSVSHRGAAFRALRKYLERSGVP